MKSRNKSKKEYPDAKWNIYVLFLKKL
jgi:hypothetical protein